MAPREYHHVHGPNEQCGPGCPAWYGAMQDAADQGTPWQDFSKQAPKPTAFDPTKWHPNAPLTSNETAFLWYATNNSGEQGDVLDDTSHWKIIDRITKRDIYDFLKSSEKVELPMLWGYVVNLPGDKMYVKFLTHLHPGKQDLEYIQNALPDIEHHFKRQIVDYDTEETTTPILESYTPTGPTSGFSTTNQSWKKDGPTDAELDEIEKQQEPDYQEMAGEFKTIKQNVLDSGVKVSTVFLGKMAPNPDQPFETLVFATNDVSGKTLEVGYSMTEQQALTLHYKMVDKYNRLALEEAETGLAAQQSNGDHSVNAHIRIMAYFNDSGILATEIHPNQLKLLPNEGWGINAVEIPRPEGAEHENGERPFMYHVPSNTLFYTTEDCHHMHIVPIINKHLEDNGHNYYGNWVTGDITDPNFENRNWIKFIGSDTGHYPESVINYLQQKFGPNRDVMYSGYDGWEELPDRYIQKG